MAIVTEESESLGISFLDSIMAVITPGSFLVFGKSLLVALLCLEVFWTKGYFLKKTKNLSSGIILKTLNEPLFLQCDLVLAPAR